MNAMVLDNTTNWNDVVSNINEGDNFDENLFIQSLNNSVPYNVGKEENENMINAFTQETCNDNMFDESSDEEDDIPNLPKAKDNFSETIPRTKNVDKNKDKEKTSNKTKDNSKSKKTKKNNPNEKNNTNAIEKGKKKEIRMNKQKNTRSAIDKNKSKQKKGTNSAHRGKGAISKMDDSVLKEQIKASLKKVEETEKKMQKFRSKLELLQKEQSDRNL
jgi:hypothetical protein